MKLGTYGLWPADESRNHYAEIPIEKSPLHGYGEPVVSIDHTTITFKYSDDRETIFPLANLFKIHFEPNHE